MTRRVRPTYEMLRRLSMNEGSQSIGALLSMTQAGRPDLISSFYFRTERAQRESQSMQII